MTRIRIEFDVPEGWPLTWIAELDKAISVWVGENATVSEVTPDDRVEMARAYAVRFEAHADSLADKNLPWVSNDVERLRNIIAILDGRATYRDGQFKMTNDKETA